MSVIPQSRYLPDKNNAARRVKIATRWWLMWQKASRGKLSGWGHTVQRDMVGTEQSKLREHIHVERTLDVD